MVASPLFYSCHSGAARSAEPGIHRLWREGLRFARPGVTDDNYPSTVLPFLITVTLRDFTLASNEIVLPSFQRSMVKVSPG